MKNKNIFDAVGMYGLPEKTQIGILASLMTGDPVLLIGPPGSGKTEAVSMLGAALREFTRKQHPGDPKEWFRYRTYDSSKINWEDLVGFPNIKKITEEEKMDFINTGTTIWGAHLVLFDELNRCREDRQSNLFEVIRSRNLHGVPTGTKFVFGAMNPYGDTGTEMMSEALVDRFMFYIHFGDFGTLDAKDRVEIIKRVGHFDAVGMKAWGDKKEYTFDISENSVNDNLASAGEQLQTVLKDAARYYTELDRDTGPAVADLIDRTLTAVRNADSKGSKKKTKDSGISARRAAMIYRGILSFRAVEYACSGNAGKSLDNMESSVINAFQLALPHGVSGSLKPDEVEKTRRLVRETVRNFWPRINGSLKGQIPIDVIYELFLTNDVFRKVEILTTYPIDAMGDKAIWSELSGNDENESINKIIYLLSLTTDIIPTHLTVKDYSKEFKDQDQVEEISLHGNLVDCSDEIRTIHEDVKDEPVAAYVFAKALDYYNERNLSPSGAFEAINTLRRMSKNLKSRLKVLQDESTARRVEGTEANPVP